MTARPTHDVTVVGAGPAGLVAAAQLARHGLDVLVLDKRRAVSTLPRAVGISVRQMEVFRSWGLEEALRAGADDVDLALVQTRTMAEAGEGTRLPVNFPDRTQSAVVSPTTPARVPQDHLEQVLVDHLAAQGVTIRRDAEVVAVRQQDDVVRLGVLGTGRRHLGEVAATYVVAADGAHSPVRELLGIATEGTDGLMRGIAAEFRAPLWPLLGRHRHALYSITEPGAEGIVIPAGGGRRWQYGTVVGPEDDLAVLARPEVLTDRIRRAVGVPDLPVHLVRHGAFEAGARLARRFTSGRVLLAGDAAHRVTPRGGNGLAMAVRDGLAVGWRLAWVLRGWAPPSFLATYEAELRPLAARDVARAADPAGHCRAVVTELHHDLGGRVSHAWVAQPAAGRPAVSTLDLVGDGLTLFAATDLATWRAAVDVVRDGPPVELVALGPETSHALGLRGGALLLRPDAVPVAHWYRTPHPEAAARLLEGAVADVLGRAPVVAA